jgi:hypothetical protein
MLLKKVFILSARKTHFFIFQVPQINIFVNELAKVNLKIRPKQFVHGNLIFYFPSAKNEFFCKATTNIHFDN